MTTKTQKEIKAYLAARDEVLLSHDVDKMIEFMKKRGKAIPNRLVAEIALNRAITAVRSLPMELRVKAKRWLIDRGYNALDDGDVEI